MQLCGDEKVIAPDQLRLPKDFVAQYHGIGGGWSAYADILHNNTAVAPSEIFADVWPRAEAAIPLAQAAFANKAYVNAAQALPVYLRDDVVN